MDILNTLITLFKIEEIGNFRLAIKTIFYTFDQGSRVVRVFLC